MREGMAKGWYEKPKGLGTDNMSCIILRFKEGHADDAVLDPEPTEEEKAAAAKKAEERKEVPPSFGAAAPTTELEKPEESKIQKDEEQPNTV